MIAKGDHSGEKKESWHCKRMISLGNSLSRSTLLISVKKKISVKCCLYLSKF